jgi:hypothetical protein
MIQIEDATGFGYSAKVNNQNRLFVQSEIITKDQDINERSGKVWSIPFENVSPTGANDYIFYIKNTGDVVIEISDFRVSSETAATQLVIVGVSGTASGGTDITPISRTVGSAASASVTVQSGSDITGITSTGTIFFMQCDTVGKLFHLSTSSKILIPKGKAVGIYAETATASLTGVVSIYEDI